MGETGSNKAFATRSNDGLQFCQVFSSSGCSASDLTERRLEFRSERDGVEREQQEPEAEQQARRVLAFAELVPCQQRG